jgi:ketosteroid isomerase-like protein
MTKTQFRDLLHSLADAWSRRDYAAAAGAFAEDVKYGDPLRYSFNGRAELRAFFEADEGYDQRTVWHTIVFDEEQQLGAAEYTYEGTHRYHGTVLVKIAGGKITRWREYQHVDPREWEAFVSATMF